MRPTATALLLLLTAALPAHAGDHTPAAQEDPMTDDTRTRDVLRAQGLPEGLLPGGIQQAEISDDGHFRVRLPRTVERTHGGYPVRYDAEISGTLDQGVVRDLQGVHARQFVWIPVHRITAVSDGLSFSVGPASRTLPLAEFPAP